MRVCVYVWVRGCMCLRVCVGGYVWGGGGGEGGSLQIGAFGILPIIMTIKPFPHFLYISIKILAQPTPSLPPTLPDQGAPTCKTAFTWALTCS